MSDTASWLSDTRERVATAELALAEVDRGLVAIEKVDKAARRAGPILRFASLALLGALVAVGIGIGIHRSRRGTPPTEPEGRPPVEAIVGTPSPPIA
jgi:hypothetical protein